MKLKYKFRIILDETWSYGVLGRTGRGVTEAQNVDAKEIDMIIGSLAGPLCAAGGFCAGTEEVVGHQRISSAAYTFSAALPAMLSTTASETIRMLQESPEMLTQLQENIRSMRAQLDPRSDWVICTSSIDNPILLLVLKPEVVGSRELSVQDQDWLLQEMVDEVRQVSCLVDFSPLFPNIAIDSRERRPDHEAEEDARLGVAAAASAEGVRDDGAVEEGDREGRSGH